MTSQKTDKRIIVGVIFVFLGLFFLLRNLDIFPFYIPHFFFPWGLFLLIGVLLTVAKRNKTFGVILMAIGVFGITDEIFNVSFGDLWPLILVFIGLSIIFRKRLTGRPDDGDVFTESMNADYIDEVAVFGGGEKMVTSDNFKGGKVTSIFSGSQVNLLNAELADGKNVIDILTIFGGTTIIVPDDWTVHTEVSSLFGAFTDKRILRLKVIANPDKQLFIRGFTMFGGGEIKNIP